MDLKAFFLTNPSITNFDESNQADHSALLELISKPMHLIGMKLFYQRTPSFSALLRAQGLKYQTLISKKNGQITGLFSISTSQRYCDGESKNVAYLGDFRIENDRKIALFWRQNYATALDLFSKSTELDRPEIFLTAILKDNKLARKTLVEKSKQTKSFHYHLLRSVKMVNVASKSFFKFSKSNYTIRYARSNEEFRIRDFIIRCEHEKYLGFDFEANNHELWKQRKENIPGFEITRFLVAEDKQNQLVAVTLPWSPDSIKRMFIKDMNFSLKMFLRLFPIFGMRIPKENESLKTLYLTHLNIINGESPKTIISDILDWLGDQETTRSYHIISFANWWNFSWNCYFHFSIEVNLFEVTSGQRPPNCVIKSPSQFLKPFGFEMALV